MDPEAKSCQVLTTISPSTSACQSPAPQHLPPILGSGSESASSQPAGLAASSFFNLPRKARGSIYKRVLMVAHPIYLFQDTGSRVETFAPDRPPRWLALLFTNRQANSEASAILYGMNNFSLLDTTRQQVGLLQAFITCIGPVNASFLSHLCINFPVVEGQPGKPRLKEDGIQSLKLLQEKCTSLTTLETHIYSNNSGGLTGKDQDSSQFIREALLQFDVQLRAIPSLDKIVIRVYGGTPTPSAMEFMQGFGWVVLPGNKDRW